MSVLSGRRLIDVHHVESLYINAVRNTIYYMQNCDLYRTVVSIRIYVSNEIDSDNIKKKTK